MFLRNQCYLFVLLFHQFPLDYSPERRPIGHPSTVLCKSFTGLLLHNFTIYCDDSGKERLMRMLRLSYSWWHQPTSVQWRSTNETAAATTFQISKIRYTSSIMMILSASLIIIQSSAYYYLLRTFWFWQSHCVSIRGWLGLIVSPKDTIFITIAMKPNKCYDIQRALLVLGPNS